MPIRAAALVIAPGLACTWPGLAHAQPCAIPPGQEALAAEILGAGDPLPGPCVFAGASLDRDRVQARYRCGAEEVEILLQHPSCAARGATLAGPFAITPGRSAAPALVGAIAERARQRGERWRWIEARDGDAASPSSAPDMHAALPRAITLALLAQALLSAAFLARRVRRRHVALALRRHWGALALLAAFGALALALPQHGPVHEHLTFVARSDCAHTLDCTGARVGWAQPAYDVYGLLFELFPYRLATLWGLSLALTTAALALLYAFAHGLVACVHGRRTARRVALVALGLAAFHPLVVRLSVGTSFWPWPLAALFGSGALALVAVRARGIDRTVALLASGATLALAVSSTPLLFSLAPSSIALLVGVRARAKAAALAAATPLALAGFHAWRHALETPAASVLEVLSRFRLGNVPYFDGALTPIPVGALFALGLAAMAMRPRQLGALLYATLVLELTLSPISVGLDDYPTRFLHGFTSLCVNALCAALGLELVRRAVARRSARLAPHVTVAAIAVIALTAPLSTESWRFLLEPRPLAEEAAQISAALDRLPPHDVLAIAPAVMDPVATGGANDPIELHYPRAEHGEVMRRRFGAAPRITAIPALLEAPPPPSSEILVYVGSPLVSWQPHEIAARVVPPDLARPELARLRAAYQLIPLHTFELDTRDHPAARTRIGAGRAARVELGFYRAVPRALATRRASARR